MMIGSVLSGPSVHRTVAARTIQAMGRFLPAEEVQTPVMLDVVFHVGGPLGEPEFEGVRTGSYSRKRNIAQVQIAVSSAEADDPEIADVMVDRLIAAVEAIGERLARAHVEVPVATIVSVIQARRVEIVRAVPTTVPIEPWSRHPITGEKVHMDIEPIIRDWSRRDEK